jgi:hypothetical protein
LRILEFRKLGKFGSSAFTDGFCQLKIEMRKKRKRLRCAILLSPIKDIGQCKDDVASYLTGSGGKSSIGWESTEAQAELFVAIHRRAST